MDDERTRAWRFEFRTDMTDTCRPAFPLAYLVCVDCEPIEGRNVPKQYFGLLYRTETTPAELARVNTETWPELAYGARFIAPLLEDAIVKKRDFEGFLARYSMFSALHMKPVKPPAMLCKALADKPTVDDVGNVLEKAMRSAFEQKLAPTMPQALPSRADAAPPPPKPDFFVEESQPALA